MMQVFFSIVLPLMWCVGCMDGKRCLLADRMVSSGSYLKNRKNYRERWTPMQRILLIPFFQVRKTKRLTQKYRLLGSILYAHFLLTLFTLSIFIFKGTAESPENAKIFLPAWGEYGFYGCAALFIMELLIRAW